MDRCREVPWPHDEFLHAWWVEPGEVLAGEYPGDPDPTSSRHEGQPPPRLGHPDLRRPDDRGRPSCCPTSRSSTRRLATDSSTSGTSASRSPISMSSPTRATARSSTPSSRRGAGAPSTCTAGAASAAPAPSSVVCWRKAVLPTRTSTPASATCDSAPARPVAPVPRLPPSVKRSAAGEGGPSGEGLSEPRP